MPSNQNNRNETMPKKSDKKPGFIPRKTKNGGGGKQDDDSIDAHGNIKGLIDYDYMSEDDSTDSSYEATTTVTSTKSPVARRTRNALRSASKEKKPIKKSRYSDEDEEEQTAQERHIEQLKSEKRYLQKLLKEKEEDKRLSAIEEKLALKKKKNSRKVGSKYVVESEEEEEEETEEEETEEEETEEEEEDDEEEEEDEKEEKAGIIFSFGPEEEDRLIPKRHNMKKESAEVKKFVKLITTPSDEDTIDGQIDQFKALADEQRTKLLSVLESRNKVPGPGSVQQGLMFKILTMNLPETTQSMVLSKYNSLQSLDPGSSEYFKLRNWLEKLTSMPLGIYKEIPVKISDGSESCGSFMEKARKCLDEAIYGQDEAKLQILQFIGTKIANPGGSGLSLLLAGPPGIGKTSLIKNGVAKALQWPFQFISLGGDSDASTYTGHQLVYESSHCGKIVNSLCAAKSMSMVLMFDELDKISTTAKGEEVQNLLVHLTDPVQNSDFEDKYLSGIPIDLSRVMFTFSANYLEKVDKVLLDRMIVVNLQGYNKKEKSEIAEHYLLPAALKEVGLVEKVGISKEVIAHIIETYASEETGVRELKRCIEQVTQKVNMLRMFNTKELPFHIKDFSLPFVLKKDHVDLFLKKKQVNNSALHMYS